MDAYINKVPENRNQPAANHLPKAKNKEYTFKFEDKRPHTIVQGKMQNMANDYVQQNLHPIQRKENRTGLPDQLKDGVESLSGFAMDDVKVHYNSSQPAKMQAHAYAQGTNIHVAPGQEKHLPHEAWHVVQQKQGRVRATVQKGGVGINDDKGLEQEADLMGAKSTFTTQLAEKQTVKYKAVNVVQKMFKRPGFVGSVSAMRSEAKATHPQENIHMAHRLSYNHIKEIVISGIKNDIEQLISNLTIPQRDFGDPLHGGVKQGDRGLYDVTCQLYALWLKDPSQYAKKLVQALNSSPYNLRPGDGQTNSSIGENADAHFDETDSGRMTPQSSALLPADTDRSSDFMAMYDFEDFEDGFASHRDSAIASVQRML